MEQGLKKIGVLACSFAQNEPEPSECNRRLAGKVRRIICELDNEGFRTIIVAQWEVSLALKKLGIEVDHTVWPQEGQYVGSEEDWTEAKPVFASYDITDVVPIAQPFLWLQLYKVWGLIKTDGYRVVKRRIGWIGFDQTSTQWWTRGPIRLLIYAFLQLFTRYRGPDQKHPSRTG